LFRTTARIDYAVMPWRIIAAYFVPVLVVAFIVRFARGGARSCRVSTKNIR
jgi:hypothetical protein